MMILRKLLTALSGLVLLLFLLVHLYGVSHLWWGRSVLDAYASRLHTLPGRQWIDLSLGAVLVTHFVLVLTQAWRNQQARAPQAYAWGEQSKQERPLAVWAGRSMVFTGLGILFFLSVHLRDFRLAQFDGSLGLRMVVLLRLPLKATLYTAAAGLVGLHLYHGFASAGRSLGLYSPGLKGLVQAMTVAVVLLLSLGFASLPIYFALFAP
jgi:succinate dehydrogenase / fumarate reductase, cytochrome b subunit